MSHPAAQRAQHTRHVWFTTMDGVTKCLDPKCPVTRDVYERLEVHWIERASADIAAGDDDYTQVRYVRVAAVKPPLSSLRAAWLSGDLEAGFWGLLMGLAIVAVLGVLW